MFFARVRLVYVSRPLDDLLGPLVLVDLSHVAGGLAAAAVAVAARQDGASASFRLDKTVCEPPFVAGAAIDRAMDLLGVVAAIVLLFVGMLLVVARPPLRLEELVDETLSFVGVLGGSRAFGGDE